MTLTLNIQGQIWNWLYLGQKCSDRRETGSKYIDRSLSLKCHHGIWPWPWPWPWMFKVKYRIWHISQPKIVWSTRNKTQIHRLIPEPQMSPWNLTLAMTLTLNFQGQIWNSLYLGLKWSDQYETKSKHLDWSLSLKCDHGIRHWLWPWPWLFKVKYGILYISAQNGPIDTKQKSNISTGLWASNVMMGFDPGLDLHLEFSRPNMEFAISRPKMFRSSWNKKQTYQLDSKPQMWPSDLTLAVILTLEFQGHVWICYILAKNGPIATKWKTHILIELKASITTKLDLGQDLERC